MIPEKPENNESVARSTNGFVALLDVLGVKQMSDEQMKRIVLLLEKVNDEVLPEMTEAVLHLGSRWLKRPIARLFSDTIIIAFPRVEESNLAQDTFHLINDYLGSVFCLFLSDNIKVRGAVGYGTIHEAKYGIFGTAINNASAEYEMTSWAGIHYTIESTSVALKWHRWAEDNDIKDSRFLIGTTHNLNHTHFYLARVPFKVGYRLPERITPEHAATRLVVPWPKDYRTIINYSKHIANDRSTMYTLVHGILDDEANNGSDRVREIVSNTLSLFDRYIEHFPDVNQPLSIEGPLPRIDR